MAGGDASEPRSSVRTTVLTVNLCILVPGLTNRRLPATIQSAVTLISLLVLLPMWGTLPLWACLLIFPFLLFVLLWGLGLPLTRVLSPLLRNFCWGGNDYKKERIDLFLQALQERPEWRSVDVICIQECYSCIFVSGGYQERLLKGARALGFRYSARPASLPSWPATLGQNTGLMILSKKPIKRSASLSFGLHFEAGNVNRGALYAGLKDGTHIFTCHVSPPSSIAGNGPLARFLKPIMEDARRQQVLDFASFIAHHAPPAEPVVAAGDFNFGISFESFESEPQENDYAADVVSTMAQKCELTEAVHEIRSMCSDPQSKTGNQSPFRFHRPTWGYTGTGDGGPAEARLSSYCDGVLRNACDDGIFYRGFRGIQCAEDNLVISPKARPHPDITHLSDHWGVRVVLEKAEV